MTKGERLADARARLERAKEAFEPAQTTESVTVLRDTMRFVLQTLDVLLKGDDA